MKKTLIRSSFSYGFIQYLILGMGFVKGIYQAKHLGPELLGTYGLIALFIEYMRYANLGTLSGMNLEASIRHGNAEKEAHVRLIVDTVFTYITMLSAIFFLSALSIRLFFPSLMAEDIRGYLFAIALFGTVGQFKTFASYYSRLHERYQWMNRLELTSSLILFTGVMALVARFKLNAIVGSMVASSIVTLGLSLWIVAPHVRPKINWEILKGLILVGFPILLFTLSEKIFTSIDRLTIVNYLPREDMGYFTLANTVLSSTMVLLSAFTVVSSPKVLKKFNLKNREGDGTKAIFNDLKKYTSILSALSIGLGLTGIILMEPFVKFLLPKYSPSIPLYQILTMGMMFDNTTHFASSYLVSNKHQFLLMGLVGLIAVFTLSGNFLAIQLGWGLKGVAAVTCISMISYGLGKLYMVLKKLGHFRVENLVDLFKRYFIILLVLVPLLTWAPSHLYLALPVFVTLYFNEIKDLLTRFRTGLVSR